MTIQFAEFTVPCQSIMLLRINLSVVAGRAVLKIVFLGEYCVYFFIFLVGGGGKRELKNRWADFFSLIVTKEMRCY